MRNCATTAAFLLLLATPAHAQIAHSLHFLFDPNGNLLVQTAAASAPPQILGQPQNRIVVPGESASFSVVAADTRALTYEWRFNGIPLGGSATNDTLLLPNVNVSKAGEYRVVLTNPSGSVTSAPAFLMIDSDADGLSDAWEMTHFGNLSQYASGDADGDGASNLQEFQDGSDPTDSNSVYFRLLVLRDGGSVINTFDRITYTNGEPVTLTGVGLPGQEPFHAWMGDILTRSNPVTLVMTNNKTVIARFTPIVFTWTNLTSGDWDIATNWTPHLAPGSNDVVIIPNGTVTLNSPAKCADVTLDAGSLTGTGTLTVLRNFLWNSGTMSGSGRTIVETSATLEIASPFASLDTRTLENAGTIKFRGPGSLGVRGGAVITNRPGALVHVQNAASVGGVFPNGQLDNAGTFRKSDGGGTATFDTGVKFNNTGVVEIETGTLSLAGGGANSGTFTTPATAVLEWAGGTFTLNPGAQLNGAGLYRIAGSGTVVSDGDLTVQNLDLVGGSGTWSGAGTLTIANAINWTAGGMRGSGRTVVPPGVTLQLGSASSVTVNRTLENGGNTFWMGTGGIIMLTGVITNRPGALFQAQNSASFFFAGGSCRFDNAGTFRKTSSTGLTTVPSGVPFNNFGTLEIRSGIFAANGGYVSTSDARLNCALGGTTPGTDYGQLQIAGAVTLNGGLRVSLTNGFVPAINDTFTVLTAGTRSGTFSDFQYPSNVVTMTLSNAPNSVQVQVTGILPPHVVGDARFFYNRSALDGNDPAANAADDGAIAIDKVPLRPGQKASFAHYTSYSRGLNGVMIDVAGFPGTPAAGDFTFKQGNDNNPDVWSPAPAPSEIAFRSNGGGGGADRLTLVWPDNAMESQWLEVTLRATATTGLSANEVFYFGNAIGETGNSVSDCNVLVNDALRILNNLSTVGVEVTNPFDINRTASVLVNDALITLNHLVAGSQALQLLDLTGGAAPASVNHSAILYVNRAGLIEAILRGEQNQLRPSGVRAESMALNASNERHVNLLAVERTVEGAWQFLFDWPRGAAPRVWQTDDLGQAQWQVVPDHQLREQWESLIAVEVPPDDIREAAFFRFELDDRQ